VPTTDQANQWLQNSGFTDIQTERRPDIAAKVIWLTATTTQHA